MLADTDELKSTFDDAAHLLSNTVLKIEDWEPWLVYFLGDLEMLAASLDPQHPNGYREMLERLKAGIESKLQKGTWESRISLASPMIKDYWS